MWRGSHRTRSNLEILLGECIHNIVSGETELCEFIGFKPDTHTEIICACKDITDSVNAEQRIPYKNIGIVIDEGYTVRSDG